MRIIRKARPEEAERLSSLAIRSKAHWGYTEEELVVFREELTIDSVDLMKGRARVAERDNTIVGFYTLADLPDSGIELGHLFVDPSGLLQGHGAALFDHACTIARAEGFSRLEIQSDPNAADFYRIRGAEFVRDDSSSIPGRTLPVFEMLL